MKNVMLIALLTMINADDRAVPAREAARVSGVHMQTLRKWANEGKIRATRTPSGQRRYDLADLKQFVGLSVNADQNAVAQRNKYVYARVSSSGQRSDLERQIESLRARFPHHIVVRDVASGLNFKRPGFLRLMDAVCAGRVEEVVVAHKDRLCRFAFDLVKWQIERFGGRLVVLDSSDRSPQEELCTDLCAVVTDFGTRLHGMRRYETKKRRGADDGAAATEAPQVEFACDGPNLCEGEQAPKRRRRASAAASAEDPAVSQRSAA